MTSSTMQKIEITDSKSIERVVQMILNIAGEAGFSMTQRYMLATAVSELATNIVKYAACGSVTIQALKQGGRTGLEIVVEDEGPGIKDFDEVREEGFSSGGGLGIGLSGAKNLVDELIFDNERLQGTKITVRKWLPVTP